MRKNDYTGRSFALPDLAARSHAALDLVTQRVHYTQAVMDLIHNRVMAVHQIIGQANNARRHRIASVLFHPRRGR